VLKEEGIPADTVGAARMKGEVLIALDEARRRVGVEGRVDFQYVDGIVLDPQGLGQVPEDKRPELRRALAEALRALDFVADVYTLEELVSTEPAERPYLELYRRSFHPRGGPEIVLRLEPYLLYGPNPSRTGHGTPYAYDAEIPILFMGPGIAAGTRDEPAELVDVAPTLAALLAVQPGATDGRARPVWR
jgi:arylsulfatase A-like enzyme